MNCTMECGRNATQVRIGTVSYPLCNHCTKEVLYIVRDAAERALNSMLDRDEGKTT